MKHGRIAALLAASLATGSCDNPPTRIPDLSVHSMTIESRTDELMVGDTMTLIAMPRAANGTLLGGVPVAWTLADTAAARLVPNGLHALLTARRTGTVQVTATSGTVSGTRALALFLPVAAVQLDRDTVILQPGDTVRLHATPRDAEGAPVSRAVTWTSTNTSTASVSPTGLVSAGTGGTARVIASAEGKSDTATIRVPGTVASVALDVDTLRLLEGAQQQLTATARDTAGLPITGRAVIWSSSDPTVAQAGALGLVTAIRPGTVEIRARVDGDTGRATAVVHSEYFYYMAFAGWSGTPGEWPHLYRLNINDPERVVLQLSADLGVGDYAVSPDGFQYVVAGAVGTVRGLYLVDRDGVSPALLLADSTASQPAWSPDGAKIAFRRWPVDGGADIWIMDADGSDLVNLTADQGATNQHTPTFSPLQDGGGYRIAYSHSPGPTAHIWTMNPDGSDKQQVTAGDVWDDGPTWAPAGGAIAFQRTGGSVQADIWAVMPSGGAPWGLVSLPLQQFAPQWSPDGVLLAFASKHETANYEIYTVRANGGGLARRTADALDKQEPIWVQRR